MSQKTIFLTKPGKKGVTISVGGAHGPRDKSGDEVEVLGLVIGDTKGSYVLDVTTEHMKKHTNGTVLIRGIAQNNAHVNITGTIKIHPHAQNTHDFLDMKVLILDDTSRATAEPRLEIEANEVTASHAATVGKIDDEQLFYLMSRGITREEARKMIVHGFLMEVIDKVNDNGQRTFLQELIRNL